jgi:hypothetical protein
MNEIKLEILIAKLDEVLARLDRLGTKPPEKEFWTPEELAEALHKKPFTVREWCRLGRIESTKDKYSRLRKIPNDEAKRLINGGSLQPQVVA